MRHYLIAIIYSILFSAVCYVVMALFFKTANVFIWSERAVSFLMGFCLTSLLSIPFEASKRKKAAAQSKITIADPQRQCGFLQHNFIKFSSMPILTYHPVHNPYYEITHICTKCPKVVKTKVRKKNKVS